jgi:hypothetical protein
VLGHAEQQSAVSAGGLAFTSYSRGRDYHPGAHSSASAWLRSLIGLVCDPGVGVDLLDVAARGGSDVLLVDCMLLGGLRAGSRAGIPTPLRWCTRCSASSPRGGRTARSGSRRQCAGCARGRCGAASPARSRFACPS